MDTLATWPRCTLPLILATVISFSSSAQPWIGSWERMGGRLGNNTIITARIFTSMFQTGYKLVTPAGNTDSMLQKGPLDIFWWTKSKRRLCDNQHALTCVVSFLNWVDYCTLNKTGNNSMIWQPQELQYSLPLYNSVQNTSLSNTVKIYWCICQLRHAYVSSTWFITARNSGSQGLCICKACYLTLYWILMFAIVGRKKTPPASTRLHEVKAKRERGIFFYIKTYSHVLTYTVLKA